MLQDQITQLTHRTRSAVRGEHELGCAQRIGDAQRPQPLAVFAAPAVIPPGALDGIPRFYVLCARDRAIPPALQRRMIRERGCAKVVELDTDHSPQLSMTAPLAEAMEQFAALSAVL